MEQKKHRVILLGFDGELLKNVTDRVNSQRPVEVSYFTDLKDFLEACIEEGPDLVGVSVSYPHARVAKFPKIFKMALNTPILTFGENQQAKTRKALSASGGDLKIQGVITAHNLWMKIVNFQKMQEEEEAKAQNGGADSESKQRSVFLKNKPNQNVESKSSILNNLFSALNDTNKPKEKENISHLKSSSSPSQNTQATGDLAKQNDKASSYNNEDGTSSGKGPSFSHIAGSENKSQKKSTKEASTQSINNKAAELADLLETDKARENKNTADAPIQVSGGSQSKATSKDKEEFNLDPLNKKATKEPNPAQTSDFGKVQLKDEKEVKESSDKKNKEKTQRDQIKQKNVLEVASEFSVEKTFKAPRAKEIRRFASKNIVVFTVDMGSIKGYLLVTNDSTDHFFEITKEFKKTLIESLKEQGAHGDISDAYLIEIEVENYITSIAEFAEFNLNHQTSEGVCINVAFVQREVVLPSLSDSDKPDMYFVDIKVIPPQTPVNFDAFIYLPRNKRFVRYLKEGRSLSLKQAKRHSEEEEGQSQLYVPKEQKRQFESFFIKNTLNWEFELHKSSSAA